MRVVSVTGNFNGDKRGEEGRLSSRGEEGEEGGGVRGSPQKAAETEAARESWGGGIGRTGGGAGGEALDQQELFGQFDERRKEEGEMPREGSLCGCHIPWLRLARGVPPGIRTISGQSFAAKIIREVLVRLSPNRPWLVSCNHSNERREPFLNLIWCRVAINFGFLRTILK